MNKVLDMAVGPIGETAIKPGFVASRLDAKSILQRYDHPRGAM